MESSPLRSTWASLNNFLSNKLNNSLASRMAVDIYYIKKSVKNIWGLMNNQGNRILFF